MGRKFDDWVEERIYGFWDSTAKVFAFDLDAPDFDINNYSSMQYYSNKPLFGQYAKNRMTYLENKELEQWKNDFEKNTGIDLSNVQYPIRAGLYGRAYAPYSAMDASQDVMDFYNPMLRKWK